MRCWIAAARHSPWHGPTSDEEDRRGSPCLLVPPASWARIAAHADHPTPLNPLRPSRKSESVYIATQRWVLEPWEGEDPPALGRSWAIKPKFAVNGKRSCAELAIAYHLRNEGWHGVWVCAYGPRELRSEWFPAPAVKTIAQIGAPMWAVEIFDGLRAANGGKLGGFFDVFAWREPGEVRFDEVKTSGSINPGSQIKFVKPGAGSRSPPRAVDDYQGPEDHLARSPCRTARIIQRKNND